MFLAALYIFLLIAAIRKWAIDFGKITFWNLVFLVTLGWIIGWLLTVVDEVRFPDVVIWDKELWRKDNVRRKSKRAR